MIIIITLSILAFSFALGFAALVIYSLWVKWIEFEIELDLGDDDYIN